MGATSANFDQNHFYKILEDDIDRHLEYDEDVRNNNHYLDAKPAGCTVWRWKDPKCKIPSQVNIYTFHVAFPQCTRLFSELRRLRNYQGACNL